MRALLTMLTVASVGVTAGIVATHEHPFMKRSLSSVRSVASEGAELFGRASGRSHGRLAPSGDTIIFGPVTDAATLEAAAARRDQILAEAWEKADNLPPDVNATRRIWPASPEKPRVSTRASTSTRANKFSPPKSKFAQSRQYQAHGSAYDRIYPRPRHERGTRTYRRR